MYSSPLDSLGGYEADAINLNGKTVCTQCVEVARKRQPHFRTGEFAVCPNDDNHDRASTNPVFGSSER